MAENISLVDQRLFVRRDLVLQTTQDGALLVSGNQFHMSLRQVTPGIMDMLTVLFDGGDTQRGLSQRMLTRDGAQTLPFFYLILNNFENAGGLCRAVEVDGEAQMTLIPQGSQYRFSMPVLEENQHYQLGKMTYLQCADAGALRLESPLSHAQCLVHTPLVTVILHALLVPRTIAQIVQYLEDQGMQKAILTELVESCVGLLLGAQMAVMADIETPLSQRMWEFKDLLFHSRSRTGRHNNPFGGTYPYRGLTAPLPAIKPPMSDKIVALVKPTAPPRADFIETLHARRSIREFGDPPITLRELGDFLYWSARQIETIPTPNGELSRRPYPAGGSLGELEIYPIVDRCQGLEPGLYHYRPADHALSFLGEKQGPVESLLEQAWYTINQSDRPQVLLVITARFQRLTFKYQSVAYALVLKHVGVVFQTMYLVATAMGLAPCALGGGNSDLFAAASGLEYLEESSVGEFVLGNRRS